MKRFDILKEIVANLSNAPDSNCGRESSVPGVMFCRRYDGVTNSCCLEKPMALLVAQGMKAINFGAQGFEVHPGMLMVSCIDTPSTSSVLPAGNKPFLAMWTYLDRRILADIIHELPDAAANGSITDSRIWTIHADKDLLDVFLRLSALFTQPLKASVLAPLIIRELYFLLLISPNGKTLRQLYMHGGVDNKIMDIISWLKENLSNNPSMSVLADMAHMSLSSFHRHFKIITGYSPLQYHKKLRLFEARRLMLAENRRVAEAAMNVGYESVTQFNREYRRLFGEPPARDISKLKKSWENDF